VVAAQQVESAGLQGSPAAAQVGPAMERLTGEQTSAPAGPTQLPAQQSPVVPQGAPSGAQTLRHERVPAASGTQRPPQHCSARLHGYPSVTQAPSLGAQRFRPSLSGWQVCPAQQSPDIMQLSPAARQWPIIIIIIGPGMAAQRPAPFAPIMQVCEQQSPSVAQRSCCGRQPEAHAHRETPSSVGSQRPEQQSLSVAHSSWAG